MRRKKENLTRSPPHFLFISSLHASWPISPSVGKVSNFQRRSKQCRNISPHGGIFFPLVSGQLSANRNNVTITIRPRLRPQIPRIRGGPNSGPLTAERTTNLFSFYCPIRIRENGKRRGNSHFCSTLHFFLLLRRRCSYNTTTTKIHCHFEGGGGVPNFFPFCCLFLLISHSQKLSDFPTTRAALATGSFPPSPFVLPSWKSTHAPKE